MGPFFPLVSCSLLLLQRIAEILCPVPARDQGLGQRLLLLLAGADAAAFACGAASLSREAHVLLLLDRYRPSARAKRAP